MPRERPRILLLDDNEADGLLVNELFAMCNYEVVRARDKAEGLHLSQQSIFDAFIISLDVNGSGFEFSQALRSTELYADVPLMFVTRNEFDAALLMETQFYGGLFVHRKPYSDIELLTQISAMVRIKFLQDELKARMAELDRLASTDPLTGLFNRRLFFLRFEQELARASRHPFALCVFFVDIDHFKHFNDQFGHLYGDEVLRHISRIMATSFRVSDIVGRIGGEEFAMVLPEIPIISAKRAAERLRQAIEQSLVAFEGNSRKVTISIGAFYSLHPEQYTPDKLLQFADAALYAAKNSGRNRVIFHEEGKLKT